MLDWCAANRLDVNWKKTFAMFVTNKRITPPTSINLHDKEIGVVNSFKLLGITIDNKLTMADHINIVCKTINIKLYSIRRLFYLATSVKIQFFKSFILPYFDYCCSLYIYFPKAILTKLSNFYYLCLFKLFKFNFEDDENVANLFLTKYGLFTFQHRIFMRFATFSHRMYTLDDAPKELQSQLKLNVATITQNDEKSNDNGYSLRSRKIFYNEPSNLKYGDLTFGKFFNKFLIKCLPFELLLSYTISHFKTYLLKNINNHFPNFIKYNLKIFNIPIKSFKYLKHSHK
jgi:hypothetical protein